ncbi:MAG: hypothetical protein ACRELG_18910, partial [Gemmataceae bacterium]
SALVCMIPKDETPTELINSESSNLSFKLPPQSFGVRLYNEKFGFLPEKVENAVPGLIEALEANYSDLHRIVRLPPPLGRGIPDWDTRHAALVALNWCNAPDSVHPKYLPKIVACLKEMKSAWGRDTPNRVAALRYLSSRKRTEAKKQIAQIEELVKDLQASPKYRWEIRQELEKIKMEK